MSKARMAWAWVPLMALLACGQGATAGQEPDEATDVERTDTTAAPPVVKDGPHRIYDAEGRLELEGTMRDGERHGLWTTYFPDGRVRSRNEFQRGKLEGVTTAFRPNGSLYYTGQHKQDKEVGTWRFYDDQGSLVRTVEYDAEGRVVTETEERR